MNINKITPISINNQQKDKLYEMCNNIIENNNSSATIYILDKSVKIPKQGKNEFGYNEIHWFEMCTTFLSHYILKDPVSYLEYAVRYSITDNKEIMHPIDYLYDEYNLIREIFKNEYNYKNTAQAKSYQTEDEFWGD